ncbi:MAG: hypothetical protein KAH23_05140 [Kiritimatiellae bacterium]|nr:hypothetical protein [Kiritimatiellia bacterium]
MKQLSILRIILSILLTSLFSGCIYSRIQIPLDTNFDNTELGTKEGRSRSLSLDTESRQNGISTQ